METSDGIIHGSSRDALKSSRKFIQLLPCFMLFSGIGRTYEILCICIIYIYMCVYMYICMIMYVCM